MRKLLTYLLLFLTINVGAQTAIGIVASSGTTGGGTSSLLAGLVSAYDLEEASGTVYDLVANNDFDDIQSTPSYHATGKIAYGINFNSASDGINLMTGAFNTTTAASLSVWVKFNQLPTTTGDWQCIFRNTHTGAPYRSFILDLETDNTWLFELIDASSNSFYVAHSAPTTGTWYHVVCVAEVGSPTRMYINNVRTNSTDGNLVNNILSTDEQSCIGNAYQGDTHSAMAIIDNVRWWTKALTDNEVNELYTKEDAEITYPWSSTPIYYISNTGSDSNDGLSLSTPWQTVAKVNASTFNPSDQILFNRGDQWRETLTVPSSGNSGASIIFGAYGSGALPVINGADILTGWANEGSNVWSNDCPTYDDFGFFAHDVHYMCIVSGALFTPVDALVDVNSSGEYFIDDTPSPSKIYMYSTGDPGSTVEVSARMFGGFISGKTYIKVENIDFRNTAHTGLFMHATTGSVFSGNNLITNCTFYRNRESGIYIENGYANNLVEYCTSSYNGNGYYLWSDDEVNANTSNNTYAHNLSEHNIAYEITGALTDGHGFGIYNSTNNIIEYNESDGDKYGINIDIAGHNNSIIIRYNYVHDGQTASPGIQVGGDAAGFTHQVYYNLVVNCADGSDGYPILILGSTRTGTVNLYNNTIYQDGTAGKSIGGIYAAKGTNLNIKNNIIYDNAATAVVLAIVSTGTGTVINNNLYYSPTLTYDKFYHGGYYNGLAAWQALGYDVNGIDDNPDFVNVASDWTLQVGSPAINAGTNVSLTSDILGNPINGTVDIGAYEKQ